MKDSKQQTRAFDNVIDNLRKLNGTRVAPYLLGLIDGAAQNNIWNKVRSGKKIKNRK